MLKRSSRRWFCILLATAVSSTAVARAGEALISIDFESGRAGFPDRPGLGVVADTERGGHALRFENPRSGRALVEGPSRSVPGGATLILEFDIKTVGEETVGGVLLGQGLMHEACFQGGNTGWQRRRVLFYLPEEREIAVAPALMTPGVMLVDNIRVVRDDEHLWRAPTLTQGVFRVTSEPAADVYLNYPYLKVFPDTVMAGAAAESSGFLIEAARNEYESFQVVVHSRREGELRLEASALQAVKGEGRIGPENIELREIRCVELPPTLIGAVSGKAGPVPDVLAPLTTLKLKPGKNQSVLITVHVPRDAAPGMYEGAVRIRGLFEASVPMRLRVWPITLPEKPSLRSIAVLRERGIQNVQSAGTSPKLSMDVWWSKFFELCGTYGQDPGLYVVNQLEGVDWVKVNPDHTVSVDFEPLDMLLAKLDRAGHGDSVQNLPPQNLRKRDPRRGKFLAPWNGLEPFTPEFEKAFGDYLRRLERHFAEKGKIERLLVYLWDEPSDASEVAQLRQLLEAAEKSAPRLPKGVAGRGAPYPELYGLIDEWTVHMRWVHVDELTRRRVRERQAAGDEVGGYGNNRYDMDMPLAFMRLWPWVLKREGMSFTGWYSVNEWGGRPWEEVQKQGAAGSRGGTGCLIYPPRADNEPVAASLRLEALRDGMEDHAYLTLLEELLRRPATRADSGPSEILQSYIAQLVSGCLEHESKNDPHLIQRVRREIAQKIIELQ